MSAEGTDESSWALDPEDESGAVVAAVGRQLKMWREAAGLDRSTFAERMGYGADLTRKIESGTRIPRPEFLDKADGVLGAGGKIAAMKVDVEKARYPKKVRDLAKLESEAVEIGSYDNGVVPGLLQTEEYIRALYAVRRPAYSEDQTERLVAARVARQDILRRHPAPLLTVVQEEAVLRRSIGGKMVLRRQLEHLLEVGQLRNVEIQVMPTAVEEHAGLAGSLKIMRLKDGTTVGHNEVQLVSRLIAEPKEVQILDMRYGMIRAQALTPRESLTFIEKVLGET
ncbi:MULTISPECIES: helix-turn-helix domain-containing protein [unclassified Streptomyces]|uniref:helix-turn-helix domain-containing protein n=1 Tax=unclassified Streptomyces TaxID=2593676 RepID=UPI002E0E7168|nr:helix-turn-helix transcriptional regulator [Streptomyces sp. NBC_01296]WSW59409.1 helix-turn-helix domain-containing protein [Streptomyces sp. NBC_00998]